jgi:hypothetical protein
VQSSLRKKPVGSTRRRDEGTRRPEEISDRPVSRVHSRFGLPCLPPSKVTWSDELSTMSTLPWVPMFMLGAWLAVSWAFDGDGAAVAMAAAIGTGA